MKTLTKCLAVILCFMVYSTNAYSERNSHHTSLSVIGDFSDESSWVEATENPRYPSSWSTIEKAITISEGSIISADGNLNPAKVHVYGTLKVGGNYEKTRSGGLEIYDGGLVIIEGNFESQDALKIHPGGSLVVKGKVITTGGHMNVGGNFIVNDDFATKGMDISSSGVLVVGGQIFDRSVGGISASGDIYITHPDPIIELPDGQETPNFDYRGMDELIEDSSNNPILKDLIIAGGIIEGDDDDDPTGETDPEDGEGEGNEPGEGETDPEEGEGNESGEGGTDPDEGEGEGNESGEGGTDPEEGEGNESGEGGTDPEEGEGEGTEPGEGETDPEDGDGEGTESGEGGTDPEDGENEGGNEGGENEEEGSDDESNNDGGVSVGISTAKDSFNVNINSTYIKVTSDNSSIVEVYNLSGERVVFQKFYSGVNEVLLPNQSGLYIAVVKSGGRIYTKKIIK